MSVEHPERYWRSLEELAGQPDFQEVLHRELPEMAFQWLDPASRRSFLKVMGASLALAGLTACTRQPAERIYPLVKEETVSPGTPQWFASALSLGGYGFGVLVRNN